MKVCVIGSKKRSESTMKIFDTFSKSKNVDNTFFAPTEFVKLGVLNGESSVIYKDCDLTKFDAVIPRIGNSKAQIGSLIIKYLKEAGVYVPFKPETPLIAHNKYLTLDALNRAKIPVPETHLTMEPSTAKRILKNMDYPVIMKLLGGSGGKGVMFAENESSAMTLIDTLKVLNQPLFIERYIKNSGEDLRLFVICDEVVTAMKRISKNGKRRTNLSSGGKGVLYRPTEEMKEIAIKSAKTIGAEICGVDIMDGQDGPCVLEVNIAPGTKISKITGVNVEDRIVDYVCKKVKNCEHEEHISVTEYVEKELDKLSNWFKETFD